MRLAVQIIFLLSILTACTSAGPLVTTAPTFTPSRTSIPSETPIPSDTPTFTLTIAPTFTVTPTSTPQPPLTEYEWNPEIVLISMREEMGDGGMSLGDLGPPPFILYADGSLFLSQDIAVGNSYRTQILTKKLGREEICQHLNTLDQTGYLDYNSSNYVFIGGEADSVGGPNIFIAVNAWKSKSDNYYDLGYYLRGDVIRKFYGQKGYPIISPALRDAYYFLDNYSANGFEVYKPDRLAVWILPIERSYFDMSNQQIKIWKLKDLPLDNLINREKLIPDNNGESFLILKNNEAKSVYSYFGQVIDENVFVIEDLPDGVKKYYAIFVRPLLPYEMPGEWYVSTIPVPGSPKPDFKLTCYPSDGVLPIPTAAP